MVLAVASFGAARLEDFDEIIDHEAGLDESQAGFRNMLFGPAVETRTVGPADPGLPELGHRAAKGPLRTRILQEPNDGSGFRHAPEFAQCRDLQLIRKHAEQESRDSCIEMAIRQLDLRHVHLAQLDFGGRQRTPAGGARQYGGTEIDSHNPGAARIEWEIPSRAHACVQYQAGKSGKELRPDLAVATVFEWQIQKVVERRNALIAREVRRFGFSHSRIIP